MRKKGVFAHYFWFTLLGIKLRKGLGSLLVLMILVGGCGSPTVVELSHPPCTGTISGKAKLNSKDQHALSLLVSVIWANPFYSTQRHDSEVFSSIQKLFKKGFRSLQHSLEDRMKAFGLMGEAMAQGVFTVSGNISYQDREYDTQGFTGDCSSKPIRWMQVEVV